MSAQAISKQEMERLEANHADAELDLSKIRRLDAMDTDEIESLIHEDTRLLFGDVNYPELLEKTHVSICLEDPEKHIVAALFLKDHPNVPSIPSWEWSHWLYNIYHLELPTSSNTFWIHLAVWDKHYSSVFASALLKSIYSSITYLEYIILVVPPGITDIDWLEGLGARILPSGFSNAHKVQTLYLTIRQHFVTKYKIRRAVEEDNDDLVPLIHAHSKRLQEYYGEFYIAEMITRHPDSGRQIIVAEYNQEAISVLCLNETANVDLLNKSFETVPFYGFRKPNERDEIHTNELEVPGSVAALKSNREDLDEDLTILESRAKISSGSASGEEIELVTACGSSSELSEDDFVIVNVSSIHLRIESLLEKDYDTMIRRDDSDDYSAVILSFNDYEMHLFSGRKPKSSTSTDEREVSSIRDNKNACPSHVSMYYGEINAFTLEVAASLPEHEAESMELLLEAAFECFPDRDYCILTIPSTCPPLPLLRRFVWVPPRHTATYQQELYILHRNILLGTRSVRVAILADIPMVEELVQQVHKTEKFMLDFRAAVQQIDDRQAFLFLNENQLIGVAVTREETDLEYICSHYDLAGWINVAHHKSGSHGLLEHVILASTFQRQSKFFLQEIHRLSDYSVLYYRIFPLDTAGSLCCAMWNMIPVRPRSQPEYTQTDLDGWGPEDVVHVQKSPYALYISTPRHLTLAKYEINTKIVVVGSSDTAIAFLDSLICETGTGYRITFNNITVVSPHGMNYQKPGNRIRDTMFVTRNDFNYRHMNLTSLRTYVNVVEAVMTAIDRKNKLLIVNDGTYLPYDYLFLFCGEQFQKPSGPDVQKETSYRPAAFPENVFLINTEVDATTALGKLKELCWRRRTKRNTVIVYGNALEAYCCIATLLEYGVAGSDIIFVESFPIISATDPQHKVSQFNDSDIDEAVQDAMKKKDIKVYPSFYFLDWSHDLNQNLITRAQFESRYSKLDIECVAMFMYNEKTVSTRTFMAINRAGLVFDGGLVIKPDCRTNDPYIYAAGTLTKYPRKYYADHMRQKYYNLDEIGRKLGKRIREKLIPCCNEDFGPDLIKCVPGPMLVSMYVKPVARYCRLPGDLRYLYVTKPGKPIPLEVAMNADDYGQVLVTGDPKRNEEQGFFKLHLNSFGIVETITCLARFDIDTKNLTSLWGKHEKLLNNLQLRFEMVLITDLFQYFREPWTCAIYHDRFSRLEDDIAEIMNRCTESSGDSLLEDLIKMFKSKNWRKLTLEQHEQIQKKFRDSQYHRILEQKLLDYLRDNDTFLSMYAHPTIVRFLLQGYENSPLFEKQ